MILNIFRSTDRFYAGVIIYDWPSKCGGHVCRKVLRASGKGGVSCLNGFFSFVKKAFSLLQRAST